MNDNENGGNEVFSRMVKAGRRTYFVAVKEASNKKKYLTVTESKMVEKDKFDRFRIMIFPEKMGDLIGAMQEAYQAAV